MGDAAQGRRVGQRRGTGKGSRPAAAGLADSRRATRALAPVALALGEKADDIREEVLQQLARARKAGLES